MDNVYIYATGVSLQESYYEDNTICPQFSNTFWNDLFLHFSLSIGHYVVLRTVSLRAVVMILYISYIRSLALHSLHSTATLNIILPGCLFITNTYSYCIILDNFSSPHLPTLPVVSHSLKITFDLYMQGCQRGRESIDYIFRLMAACELPLNIYIIIYASRWEFLI